MFASTEYQYNSMTKIFSLLTGDKAFNAFFTLRDLRLVYPDWEMRLAELGFLRGILVDAISKGVPKRQKIFGNTAYSLLNGS